jgi:predicted TIM-barrel fold metal-dependent hydrolase
VSAQPSVAARRPGTDFAIVDADVHAVPTAAGLAPYLPSRWRGHAYGGRTRGSGADVIRLRAGGARADADPPSGLPPGGDPEFMAQELLDRYGTRYAVINVIGAALGPPAAPGLVEANVRATNEWIAAEWLDRDPRWRASISVPYEHPGSRVIPEIERWAKDDRFVQVGALSMRTDHPLGDVRYWDMYEALCEYDLPLAIHPGGSPGVPVTGSGWPSYYLEDHAGYPQANPSHVASLVFNGVFDRFPTLKVVIVEGGWSWVPSVAWRLDACWRVMRDEVPELERKPSEYLHDHLWFTTQPIDEPEDPRWLAEMFERSGIVDRIMYSSDYPHWDFDSPKDAIPRGLPEETRRLLFNGTACALYGLSVDDG